MRPHTHIGLLTATSLVVANMIGTGVFTSLGFQLAGIDNGYTIVLLWLAGGLFSLCGAMVYGEMGAAFPRNGGEYHFLTRLIHPFVGFLGGWVSATVGFAAPVALAASLMGGYASRIVEGLNEQVAAILVVLLISLIHLRGVHTGSRFQNVFTIGKVLLMLLFVVAGFFSEETFTWAFSKGFESITGDLGSQAFITSLFFVSYSYCGWNASAYMAGQIDRPEKNLHRSLIFGTLIVTLLYVLINICFLKNAPLEEMQGIKEVAYAPARHIFGAVGASFISGCIILFLISSISSMVMTGPRVTEAMGNDIKELRLFSRNNSKQTPVAAILLQAGISVALILSGSFEQVLTYLGFTLNLFTLLTVGGYSYYRFRKGPCKTYATPFFPLMSGLFMLYGGWILVFGLIRAPFESIAGLLTLVAGGIFYFFSSSK